MNNGSPETLQSLTKHIKKSDVEIVASTYYRTPEAEEKRIREIFRENIGFWQDFREIARETDPENVQAMMRGAVLLLGALSRREEVDQLNQSLQDQSQSLPNALYEKTV